jgi:hypothetical protein
MATFYLLPPRPLLGERLAAFLQALLPGLDWDSGTRGNLAEAVLGACVGPGAGSAAHLDVHVVYREDIPAGETPARALADGYGAEPGDEVVEVRPGARAGEFASRRWRVA